MRIATWNVAYGMGEAVNQRRSAKMAEIDADVWILTETHDDLSPGPEFRAVHGANRPLDDGNRQVVKGSRFVSIWVKNEGSPTSLDVTDRVFSVACLVGTEMGPLVVFGTVLPWYGRGNYVETVETQSADWRALGRESGANVCVAGDFNADLEGGPHYYGAKTSKRAITEALAATGLTLLTGYERTRSSREHGLIDHITISNDVASGSREPIVWDMVDAEGRRLSDHVGVAVDVPGIERPR